MKRTKPKTMPKQPNERKKKSNESNPATTCWSESVGERGYQVTIYERRPGGNLWLRWWVPKSPTVRAHPEYNPLGHRDREVALQLARKTAAGLLASTKNAQTGRPSVGDVLAAYRADVVPDMKGCGPKESARRIAMWSVFLGPDRFVDTIDKPLLDRFTKERLVGKVEVPPPFRLKAKVSKRAAGADLEFLRAALRHAMTKRLQNGQPMLTFNPMAGYEIPENVTKQRPVTTYDRFLAMRKAAKHEDEQGLFEHFLTLIEALGWRLSAICALRGSDVDLRRTADRPHGAILKDQDVDKEGNGGWVPLDKSARAALEILTRRGKIRPGAPLFPAPIALDESGNPRAWDRHHARKLFDRTEKRAGLAPLRGGDFHPFRRKWATERKYWPVQDVAAAGGWLDYETLQDAYQHSDPETMFAVMTEPRKLRERPVKKGRRTEGQARRKPGRHNRHR